MRILVPNLIWDYADIKAGYINQEQVNDDVRRRIRILVNLDILNGTVALLLTFIYPITAFFLLFFRLPTYVLGALYTGVRRRQARKKS